MARKIPTRPRTQDDPPIDPARTTQDVLDRCARAGFALAGIAPVQGTAFVQELREWLLAGKHGEMEWLAQDQRLREQPGEILKQVGEGLESARAFVVVADQYATRLGPPEQCDTSAPDTPLEARPQGRVARYAQGRNYHDVMKRRLHALADALRQDYPGSEFRTCVDTAPILEREIATLAGLGWQAKNTMVIHPRIGSYFLLGVVATNLPLLPNQSPTPDACGTCTRCIDACPTRAITPYSIDARRCISYLTIEHRSIIDPSLHAGMGEWVFGCDICQEVCPHNSPRADASATGQTHHAYTPSPTRASGTLSLLEVLGWGEGDRREAFQSSPMKRATLAMMRRNALVALTHAILQRPREDTLARAWTQRIQQIALDASEHPLVRETAAQSLQRVGARAAAPTR